MESLEDGDMDVECRMLPVPARQSRKRDVTFGTLSEITMFRQETREDIRN